MHQSSDVVIADTTCFILLEKIGELQLLQKLFNTITTTPIVAREYGSALPEWVQIKKVSDSKLQDALQIKVDAGEASAIALATELSPALVILDDFEARKLARQLKLTFVGTLGLILRAKLSGHIDSIKPIIEKMQATNFRVADKLYLEILIQAKEL